jgi:NitT/TauT family transport system permease protein
VATRVLVEAEGRPAQPPRRSRTKPRRWPSFVVRWVVVVSFLVGWQLLEQFGLVNKFFVSSPIAITERIWQWTSSGSIVPDVEVTLHEALEGFAIGAAMGIVVGFLLGRFQLLSDALQPLLDLANTLPRIALAPLFILWFGIDELSKVVLVFTTVVFILLFNTYAGIQTVNEDYVNTARLLGANEWQVTTKVMVPWCIPWIFVGLRLGLAWSLSGAVVGEFLAARAGVGFQIFYASSTFDMTGVLAGCFVLLLMAVAFFVAINFLERRLLRWRPARV